MADASGRAKGWFAAVPRERRLKLAGFGALAILALVFVIQNNGATEISLLWWSVRMPLFFVLLAMIAIGVALDRAWAWRRRRQLNP